MCGAVAVVSARSWRPGQQVQHPLIANVFADGIVRRCCSQSCSVMAHCHVFLLMIDTVIFEGGGLGCLMMMAIEMIGFALFEGAAANHVVGMLVVTHNTLKVLRWLKWMLMALFEGAAAS